MGRDNGVGYEKLMLDKRLGVVAERYGCYYTLYMQIEWDERKNRANIRKHELDFSDAWKVFMQPVLITLDERSGEEYAEDRWIGIGLLDETRIVVIIFTELEEDVIRVISFRKALTYEREQYQEAYRDEFGAV